MVEVLPNTLNEVHANVLFDPLSPSYAVMYITYDVTYFTLFSYTVTYFTYDVTYFTYLAMTACILRMTSPTLPI